MKIEMLTERPEHWVGGPLCGKGIVRPAGGVFEIGESDLEKVQQSSADLWMAQGWAKELGGAGPITAIEGEKDGD